MAKSFKNLESELSPRAKEKAESLFKDLLRGYPLAALRAFRGLTQEHIAKKLLVSQAAISRLESRQDFFLSTLYKYVQATEGSLSIHISYGDSAYELKHDPENKTFHLSDCHEFWNLGTWANTEVLIKRPRIRIKAEAANMNTMSGLEAA